MPRSATLLEREYGKQFSEYRAYINDSLVGDVTVEYVARENKERSREKAREKALNLEKLLGGKLIRIEVKRDNDTLVIIY